jgi:biotin-(acetyl-CoA carboxylase) ligase
LPQPSNLAPDPDRLILPPPYTLVRLREHGDAFVHGCAIAASHGAGTLIHVGRFDLAEFAVVLEPDEPLRSARRAFQAGMVALTDALRAHAPPQKEVAIGWPDAVKIDGGLVGGGRLGWPEGTAEDEVPAWLVFGAMIRTVAMGDEPGLHPLASALDQEGFGDTGAAQITESFARHLMTATHRWQTEGFAGVAGDYLARLPREAKVVSRVIDDTGDLLVKKLGDAEATRLALVPALRAPSWLDPATGGPRL